jgi:hypothetical protein
VNEEDQKQQQTEARVMTSFGLYVNQLAVRSYANWAGRNFFSVAASPKIAVFIFTALLIKGQMCEGR